MSNKPEENFDTWVKTLEEESCKQAVKRLHIDNCFCVIGVACNLYINSDENVKGYKWTTIWDSRDKYIGCDGELQRSNLDIIEPVRNWLGLKCINPTVIVNIKDVITEDSRKEFSDELWSKLSDQQIIVFITNLNDGVHFHGPCLPVNGKSCFNLDFTIDFELRKHTFKEIAQILKDQKETLLLKQ